jgi:hypothetical protein
MVNSHIVRGGKVRLENLWSYTGADARPYVLADPEELAILRAWDRRSVDVSVALI